MCPIGAGAHAEFRPEGAIEVRDVAKAAIERDVQDGSGLGNEPQCRLAQPGAAHVLMWCDASQVLECPKGTVMSRLHYARRRLQARLRGLL